MKNLLIALSITMLAAGCSSGTTVADLPSNVTSTYRGSFANTPGTQSGRVTIDIQDVNGVVSGNIIFNSSGPNCLRNAVVQGTSTGFNLNLTAPQAGQEFTIVIVESTPASPSGSTPSRQVSTNTIVTSTGSVGVETRTLANGNIEVRTTTASDVSGTLNLQFTIANSGDSLSGTYTIDGNLCSNGTGSGRMTLTR